VEEVDISTADIVWHVLVSWVPWLLGIVVGGGLGFLCGLGVGACLAARPGLRRPWVLLPWRTGVMGLLLAAWSPFVPRLLGLGLVTGGAMVGVSVGLLALAFTATTLVENRHPSPLGARLVAGARTLAVASGLFAAGAGLLGGGGLGQAILSAARLQAYGLLWQGLLVILSLALVLDLSLGLVQMIALRPAGHNAERTRVGRPT
jgi:hypothetical protein